MHGSTKILFRTEASSSAGLGHALRCLAVAEALRERGADTALMLDKWPSGLQERAVALGVDALTARAPIGTVDDAEALTALDEIAVIVFDSYQIDEKVLAQAHIRHVLAVFDDLFALAHYPVDLIINSARHAATLPYGERTAARLLLGPEHAPLRPEFARWRASHPLPLKDSDHLVLTLGGSDPLGLTAPLAKALRRGLPQAHLVLLVGSANQERRALEAIAEQDALISTITDPPSVADVFGQARLVISASGGTTAELAAMGLPTLALVVADNQMEAARSGIYPFLDARTDTLSAIAALAASLWENIDKRNKLSQNARAAVDGLGAGRIADALLALSSGKRV